MIYKHEKWGDDKHYSIINNGMGQFKVIEFFNRCKKTELTMTTEEKIMFVKRLKENDWYELEHIYG